MHSALWLTIVSAEVVTFARIVLLLRNTFSHQFGFGKKLVDVPKPVAVIILWLAVAVPLTAILFLVRAH